MNSKYVLDVVQGQENSAGSKAKQDVTEILLNAGFKALNFKIPESKIMRVISAGSQWTNLLSEMSQGVFVCQYPMYSRFSSLSLMRKLKNKKNIKTIAIVHDVESIRGLKKDIYTRAFETKFLNEFDCLIVHNSYMKNWLQHHGIQTKMVTLNIFDYLNPQSMLHPKLIPKLVFAGNLEKSIFLSKLNIQTKVNLYGPNQLPKYPSNISYKGMYTPEELPKYLDGAFGLVWDGTSIETCDGMYGKYLKYNNPHKTSLYLSSGLPVIVWKKSAMSEFVIKNGVGIAVNSLEEVDDRIEKMTNEVYQKMLKNVNKVASRLREGDFLMDAVKRAIEL